MLPPISLHLFHKEKNGICAKKQPNTIQGSNKQTTAIKGRGGLKSLHGRSKPRIK